jgi:hypothetical protein
MKTKISLVSTSLMFILFSGLVLATKVTTDYSGNGDFQLTTNIQSPISPSIIDSAEIHTGCDGGCCCCPYCSGSYEGTQVVTNNPFSASGDQASVTNGCIALEQTYYDEYDNRKSETLYYTYFDGNGTAESYVYASPGQGLSYQLANGTGSSWVSFSQIVYLDGNFDYATTYGGAAWVCEPGYAEMVAEYSFGYYNTQLGLYCVPVNESSHINGFLHAKTTDLIDANTHVEIGSIDYYENVGADGMSQYDFVVTSYDDLLFDTEMWLG